MVIVKTVLGSFDTNTKKFVEVSKATAPKTALSKFSLLTKPPNIIPIPRFGGQKATEAKKSPATIKAPRPITIQTKSAQRSKQVRNTNRRETARQILERRSERRR